MTNLMVVERMGKDIQVINFVLVKYLSNKEYQSLTTLKERSEINKALNVIREYQSLSEDYFLANKTIDGIDVYYRLGIKPPPFVKGDVCAMCGRIISEDHNFEKVSNYHIAEKMGREIQLIRREIKGLMSNQEYVRLADKDITDMLSKSIQYIDRYISKTEERLIKRNVITSNEVFYDLYESIENGSIAEVCLLCHKEK